jgi:hypothetical protein
MRRIYLTHCSGTKDPDLRASGESVPPDRLYTARWIQRFMSECKSRGADWAIYSDLHGVWFPNVKHPWYEKAPWTVTSEEFQRLVADFNQKLSPWDEIWFYVNPGRLHPTYRRLLDSSELTGRVHYFSKKAEIV